MRDILRQMGRNDVTVVDRELGFQICRRDTVPFIVLGSFTKGGNIFATDVKLIDVERKSTVKSASSRGEGAESILQGQIDELSEQIAEGVGLSVPLLAKSSRPVAEVTTTSLEAYESYLRGREAYRRYEDAKARELLEAALTLDSTFAEASYWLASNLNNLGLIRERDERIRQALRHKVKANDVDRLYIEAAYAGFIEKDYDRRAGIYEAILERAPTDPRAHLVLGNHFYDRDPPRARRHLLEGFRLDSTNSEFLNTLGYVELNTGNFEKALGYFQQYVARSPESPNPYDSMGEIYFRMGWLDNALDYFLKAVDVQPEFSDSYFRAAYVCALREDYDQVWTLVERGEATAPSVAIEAWGEFSRAFYSYWLGQPGKAAGHLAQVKLLAKQAGSLHWRTVPLLFEARLALDKDEVDRGRALMNEWLGLVLDDTNPEYDAFRKMVYLAMQGLCDVQSGRNSRAWLRVDSMRTISPQVKRDRAWAEWTCNQLIAEMLLGAGRYEECLSLCDSLRPAALEYLYPAQIMLYNTPFQGDLRARALVRKGEPERAIAEYERLVRFEPRSDNRRLVNPLYRYRLGVLYQEQGETEKAIEQFRRFVALWSKAEADQPELPDAKRRLAALGGTSS